MKKSLFFSIALVCSTLLFAQESSWKTLNLLPDANGFLPRPASTWADNQQIVDIPALQEYDETIYEETKLLRETDRGIQAEYEESYQALPSRFAEVLEADIADANTFSKINALVKACVDLKSYHTGKTWNPNHTEEITLRGTKGVIARKRPRALYSDENYSEEDAGSYPSGHGYAEWLVASCLAYINPAKSTQIYKIAPEYGYSRVIIAAHWMTDINAGERLAAAAFPTLVSNPDFLQLLNEARDEYQEYKNGHPAYETPQVMIGDEFDWATKYASYSSSSDETMTILRRYNGQHIVVTLGRTFKGGMWNTVCLPFSLETLEGTPFEGAQVIAFTDAQIATTEDGQELVLAFEPVTSMQAGVSYLVNIGSNDLMNPIFENVLLLMKDPHVKRVNLDFTRDVTHNGFTLHGVISQKSVSPTNTLFLGLDNTLYHPSTTGTMKGFRAYFEVPAAAAQLPARISLNQGGTPTDIIVTKEPTDAAIGSALAPAKVLKDGEVVITTGENEYLINGTAL